MNYTNFNNNFRLYFLTKISVYYEFLKRTGACQWRSYEGTMPQNFDRTLSWHHITAMHCLNFTELSSWSNCPRFSSNTLCPYRGPKWSHFLHTRNASGSHHRFCMHGNVNSIGNGIPMEIIWKWQ